MLKEEFDKPYDVVFKASRKALKELDMDIEEVDHKRGTIIATTGTSWLSWGEEIQIIFKNLGLNRTRVTIESNSPNQLISWGKNGRNEEDIYNRLLKILKNR